MTIGIIGGGIVGMTTAFLLAQNGHTVTVYDDQQNQATKAAAGIICPWLSQRRNKAWYRLTANGANYYTELLNHLKKMSIDTSFYRQNGALLFKKSSELLDKLECLAHDRKQQDTAIGTIRRLNKEAITQLVPELTPPSDALFISGGARIDGQAYLLALKQAAQQYHCHFITQRVTLEQIQHHHDKIIICAGAYAKELLASLNLFADVIAQKGQLFTVKLSNRQNNHYPVIIPQSEFDFLPFEDGDWVIGATHEKGMGFDNTVDFTLLEDMKQQASLWLPELQDVPIQSTRVGTRAFTSDYTPFFGKVPTYENIYIASGLGSSGLTNGPYIAYLLSCLIDDKPLPIDISPFSPNNYIKSDEA